MHVARKYGLGMIAFSALIVVIFVALFMEWHRRGTIQEATREARDY
jgi:cytochrome c oxidase assembly factor CtaG